MSIENLLIILGTGAFNGAVMLAVVNTKLQNVIEKQAEQSRRIERLEAPHFDRRGDDALA